MTELDRLFRAIEQLLASEAIALRSGNLPTAASVQSRIGALIVRLAEVVRESGIAARSPADLAERVHRLKRIRRENLELLRALRREREAKREQLRLAQSRVKQAKPAYAASAANGRRSLFSAAG